MLKNSLVVKEMPATLPIQSEIPGGGQEMHGYEGGLMAKILIMKIQANF